MNINILNPSEFMKSEFIDNANALGVKVYPEIIINELTNVQKGLIEKAERAELNDEEKEQLNVCKSELSSIKKVVLVNNELGKENWFIRIGQGADIEKSKKANVGEIHEWNGKRYRKEANRKWVEVSEHVMSKKEHEDKAKEADDAITNRVGGGDESTMAAHDYRRKKHLDASSKLSDKEHSDEEVGLGKENKESEGKKEGDKIKVGDTYILEDTTIIGNSLPKGLKKGSSITIDNVSGDKVFITKNPDDLEFVIPKKDFINFSLKKI